MLAECLRAWWPTEDPDATAASLVVAEVLLKIRAVLTKKGK